MAEMATVTEEMTLTDRIRMAVLAELERMRPMLDSAATPHSFTFDVKIKPTGHVRKVLTHTSYESEGR